MGHDHLAAILVPALFLGLACSSLAFAAGPDDAAAARAIRVVVWDEQQPEQKNAFARRAAVTAVEAGGHPLGVTPPAVELADGDQPGVAGQLPLVPLDNQVGPWEKVEAQLRGSPRYHLRPPWFGSTLLCKSS